jgi:hypothetical protein
LPWTSLWGLITVCLKTYLRVDQFIGVDHRATGLAPGTIINIASGAPRRIGDFLDALLDMARLRVEIVTDKALQRHSEIVSASGNAARAYQLLSWKRTVPWTQTLADVLADWRERTRQRNCRPEGVSVAEGCRLMGISRSAYYDAPAIALDDTAIVEAMSAIRDEFEHYGWRRVQAALRQQGLVVNHKKVKRLMREHDLQPRMRRRYVATTDSDHDHPTFRNLAKDKVIDGANQLWVADRRRRPDTARPTSGVRPVSAIP